MKPNFLLGLVFSTVFVLGYLENASAGEIHDAAWLGDVKKLEALLRENPKLVDSEDVGHFRPLHFAIRYSHPEAVECLLKNGADINGASTNGVGAATETPIQTAMFTGWKQDELVELLLKHGAKCGLVEAAALGRLEIVMKLLKENPTSVDTKTSFGSPGNEAAALFWAAARGQSNVVDFLLKNKADVNVRENGSFRRTPLLISLFYGKKDLVKLLLTNGADPNTADVNGWTGLHYLVNAGPKCGISPGPNPKPLHWTASQDYVEMAQMLLDSGAQVNAKDNAGHTPLKSALNPGGSVRNLADFLRKHGGQE